MLTNKMTTPVSLTRLVAWNVLHLPGGPSMERQAPFSGEFLSRPLLLHGRRLCGILYMVNNNNMELPTTEIDCLAHRRASFVVTPGLGLASTHRWGWTESMSIKKSLADMASQARASDEVNTGCRRNSPVAASLRHRLLVNVSLCRSSRANVGLGFKTAAFQFRPPNQESRSTNFISSR